MQEVLKAVRSFVYFYSHGSIETVLITIPGVVYSPLNFTRLDIHLISLGVTLITLIKNIYKVTVVTKEGQLSQSNAPAMHCRIFAMFTKMTLRYTLKIFFVSTWLKTFVLATDECHVNWVGGKSLPFDECNLLFNDTLEVELKKLVDKPECLNENTGIGIAVNQEVENKWDSKQKLNRSTVFTFDTTKSLCYPLNLTIGMYFWSGRMWKRPKVRLELNPCLTCLDKTLSGLEKEEVEAKCPNLTWASLPPERESIPTEPTSKTDKLIEVADTSEGESEWKLPMEGAAATKISKPIPYVDESEYKIFSEVIFGIPLVSLLTDRWHYQEEAHLNKS